MTACVYALSFDDCLYRDGPFCNSYRPFLSPLKLASPSIGYSDYIREPTTPILDISSILLIHIESTKHYDNRFEKSKILSTEQHRTTVLPTEPRTTSLSNHFPPTP